MLFDTLGFVSRRRRRRRRRGYRRGFASRNGLGYRLAVTDRRLRVCLCVSVCLCVCLVIGVGDDHL